MGESLDFADAAGLRPFDKRSEGVVVLGRLRLAVVAEMHDSGGDQPDGGCSRDVRENNLAKTIYTSSYL